MFAAATSTGTRKPTAVYSQSANPPAALANAPTRAAGGARALKPTPSAAAANKPGTRKSGIAAMFKAHEAKRLRTEE